MRMNLEHCLGSELVLGLSNAYSQHLSYSRTLAQQSSAVHCNYKNNFAISTRDITPPLFKILGSNKRDEGIEGQSVPYKSQGGCATHTHTPH